MGLWDWALEVYARPGVPEACLALQDDHGQNTSYLLWAAWAGGLPTELLSRGVALAQTWDATTLVPLRQVRRALKAPMPQVEDRARESLRQDVKASELRAEQVLMEALARLSGGQSRGGPALTALRAASLAWGSAAPEDLLATLAQGLGDSALP